MAKVNCPLMEGKIEDEVCFDIHMVAEGSAPEFTAPKKAVRTQNFKEICKKCPNHRED